VSLQNWDRLVMILIGGGVAVYSGYGGWRSWQKQEKQAAIGAFLLAAATVALPIALAIFSQ
jgi:uncharacterized membrane protein